MPSATAPVVMVLGVVPVYGPIATQWLSSCQSANCRHSERRRRGRLHGGEHRVRGATTAFHTMMRRLLSIRWAANLQGPLAGEVQPCLHARLVGTVQSDKATTTQDVTTPTARLLV